MHPDPAPPPYSASTTSIFWASLSLSLFQPSRASSATPLFPFRLVLHSLFMTFSKTAYFAPSTSCVCTNFSFIELTDSGRKQLFPGKHERNSTRSKCPTDRERATLLTPNLSSSSSTIVCNAQPFAARARVPSGRRIFPVREIHGETPAEQRGSLISERTPVNTLLARTMKAVSPVTSELKNACGQGPRRS